MVVRKSPEDKISRPMDLVRDPIGDDESSVQSRTPEQAKLAADIHGPRTVHPDSGVQPSPSPGGNKGGGDPSMPS